MIVDDWPYYRDRPAVPGYQFPIETVLEAPRAATAPAVCPHAMCFGRFCDSPCADVVARWTSGQWP